MKGSQFTVLTSYF